jgi:hypothetical protein
MAKRKAESGKKVNGCCHGCLIPNAEYEMLRSSFDEIHGNGFGHGELTMGLLPYF